MKRIHGFAAAILALVAMSVGPCSADKVTSDPNTGSARQVSANSADVADSRLAQKVTYDGGYKRLHYSLEGVSAKTGVTIRCGANRDDWQVRDLPMAISAYEIPLGKLLEAIASSADLDLTSETIKTDTGKGENVYRLSFTMRSRAALDGYVDSRHQATVDQQGQLWDALVANADIPDSDVDLTVGSFVGSSRALAKVIKELGPDAKAKVFAGERIDLNTGSFSNPAVLREWYRSEAGFFKQYNKQGEPPTNEQIDAATFSIIPSTNPTTGAFSIGASVPVRFDTTTVSRIADLRQAAQELWWQKKIVQKAPSIVNAPLPDQKPPDHIAKDLVPLDIKSGAKKSPDFMAEKVKLDLPKDRDVSYAEAFAALAKAAGLSIVTEDYLDHKHKSYLSPSGQSTYLGGFGMQIPSNLPPFSPVGTISGEATVGDVLRALTLDRYGSGRFQWFCNEKTRLLVGRDRDWMQRHQNLMPESLLIYLRDKANGDGIELDDLSKLTSYTEGQQSEWIRVSKDLYFISGVPMGRSSSQTLWRFYEKLPAFDRAAAKSDAGLPLAKYEAAWVADFTNTGPASDPRLRMTYSDPEEQRKHDDEAKRQTEMLANPEAVRNLTLKIAKIPTRGTQIHVTFSVRSDGSSADSTSPPKALDGHTYYAVVQGDYAGERINIQFDPLYRAFPVYSPQREAELVAKKDNAGRK